jgi:hypothetical protein
VLQEIVLEVRCGWDRKPRQVKRTVIDFQSDFFAFYPDTYRD